MMKSVFMFMVWFKLQWYTLIPISEINSEQIKIYLLLIHIWHNFLIPRIDRDKKLPTNTLQEVLIAHKCVIYINDASITARLQYVCWNRNFIKGNWE